MSTLTFDTLKYSERLRAAGVSDTQAKAEAEALRDVLAEAADSSLATKSDISQLEATTKTAVSDLRSEIVAVKGELSTIKWMMGVLIALAVANFAKQFF
jgi:hypothetical protein